MSETTVLEVFRSCMVIILQLAGPVLIISMLIGLVVSILQAATQVHEQTLTFVPKLAGIAVILLIAAPWIIAKMNDFAKGIFDLIATL